MSLDKLFNPRGIAIAGASGDPTRPGGQTVRALNEYGYRGGIYPVNPRYPELAGHRCFPSIGAIEGDCDLAVVALPAAQVAGVLRECGQRGIRFAVVLGGGFRETGPAGAALETEMLAAAHDSGVRIIGPNCLGLVNVHARVFAAFGSIAREPELKPGGVSAVIQSGGFGNALVIRCALAGVGFRYLVASGNESDISAPELLDAYVDDAQTKVILAYLEGVTDGRALMAAGRRALAARKPLLVLKAGNTEQGRRAAASHTANLTGQYDIYRGAFRQCGIIEVRDIDEAADFALALLAGRLPKGRNVALMGGSGGSAAVFADAADALRLTLPPLAPQTTALLEKTLPTIGSLRNPIDYTAGYPRPETADSFLRAYSAVLADPGIDQLTFMFATAGRSQLKIAGELLAQAMPKFNKPVLAFSAMTDEIAPEGMAKLRAIGVPVLPSPARVARAMAMLADYAEALARATPAVAAAPGIALPALPAAGALDEHASKGLLAAAGIPVSRDILLPPGSAPAASGLGFPLAVKIVSRDIPHKSDIGGVRLNVSDGEQLAAGIAEVTANARRAVPHAKIEGVLVSEMVSGGVETIVGVVNDAGFGPVVAFGIGGVLAEAVRDMAYRVAPFGAADARAMIGEIRMKALLDGVRGRPACDTEALAGVLVRVSELAWQMRERLAELDINPLVVRPAGAGVVAVDALIVLR
jgi:acyl-CoA synthetase (NDP forming)